MIVDGASRDRTGDLLLAKQALSQLSYGPWDPQYTRYGADFRSAPAAMMAPPKAFDLAPLLIAAHFPLLRSAVGIVVPPVQAAANLAAMPSAGDDQVEADRATELPDGWAR